VRNIDFYVICATANSNKFPKNQVWKEKSVEDVVTLGPTAQTTLVLIIQQGIEIHKNCWRM